MTERADQFTQRGPEDADEDTAQGSGTAPHPSPAEGGSSEAADRAPRPSQAEGGRDEELDEGVGGGDPR